MPDKIFVSYRRDDAAGDARGVRDALTAKFGASNVFMDVDNLRVGQRFDVELGKALGACDVFIAIIGPRWMDLLRQRNVEHKYDYVRAEIAAALQRGITVIPVRVGREGNMPRLPQPEELPEDLRALAFHQKHDIAHERFGRDSTDLIAAIVAVRATRGPQKPPLARVSWRRIGAMAAGVLTIGCWVGAHQMGVSVWWPFESKASRPLIDLTRPVKQTEAKEVARRDPIAALVPGSGQSARDTLTDGSPCSFCPEMVVVPAGHFTMGSPEGEPQRENSRKGTESPQHDVSIGWPFAVGRFAITRGEYAAFVRESNHAIDDKCWTYEDNWDERSGRSFRNPGFTQDDRHPVVCIIWDDAKAFAVWLSRKTGKSYRLLSESEREYVTRAGTTTPFWWGSSITPDWANYNGYALPYKGGGSMGEFRKRTMQVDSFEPNPWALYQVHGNVFEWTEDCWHDTYQGAPTDGTAWTTGCSVAPSQSSEGGRVVRGGSWNSDPKILRSAYRIAFITAFCNSSVGLRVARTLNP
jgi:formylglycine-generating enzyme required for sulfatase activity